MIQDLHGTDGENRQLLVTTNGGKTFEDANIVHLDSIKESNLFVEEVPYIEDGILKLKLYTTNKYLEKTYYEFYSKDNGLTWIYSK